MAMFRVDFGPQRKRENIEDFSQLFDCPHRHVCSTFEKDAGANTIVLELFNFDFRKVFSQEIDGRRRDRVDP